MKKTIYEAVMIIFVSVCIALFINQITDKNLSMTSIDKIDKSEKSLNSDIKRLISIEDAIQDFKDKNALFADARSSDDFDAGHIPGAISLPEHEFDELIGEFFQKTDSKQKIITYCHGTDCDMARQLTEKLFSAGFENTYYISDGWGKWQEKGLLTESRK